ncbi:hypothetical protein [Acetobacter persici]|uniref:hypothetical protein n=1 Tax=Acetobacter persici TaxID=1076596 RepID=UPI001F3B9CCB|nr:hypothetical protein [Acetobacter persici]MCG0998169.1 hypothetical protein [Acetobacter persici]
MSDHEIKHAGGNSPSFIKIVLTAGVVALGFEVAQQVLARAYCQQAWHAYWRKKESEQIPVHTRFQTRPSDELRSQWVTNFFEATGVYNALWLLMRPRDIPQNIRAYMFIASLWILLSSEQRKKFISRGEFYDFCEESRLSIRDLLIKREAKL